MGRLKPGEKSLTDRFGGDYERKSRLYSWLSSNRYLRRVIVARIEASGYSRAEVSRGIKVDRSNLTNYLNSSKKNPRSLSDLHILKLCEFIGIEFSLEITKISHESKS